MKKTISILAGLTAIMIPLLHAQTVEVKWSELQVYENKTDGYFEEFIGNNSQFIYAKFNKIVAFGSSDKKVKLVAYDKKTMRKVASAALIGFPENQANKDKYKKLKYYKTIIFENIIYVFWFKTIKNGEELYVQSFNQNLARQNSLKKVYEISSGKGYKESSSFVLGNKNAGEHILIGGELGANKGENLKVEYKLLKNDFSFASANQITLPITIKGKSDGLTSTYELGDDGNLYIETYISMSKEERKNAKKGESMTYPVLTMVELASGTTKPYYMKFDNKNISGFDYVVNKTSTKVFGFFCDLLKDPKGNDTHGIFYTVIDNKTFQMISDVNFAYFDKIQLDKLFAKDREDRKDKKVLQSKKKKKSEDESIASNYVIEDVQSLDKDNLVLFCSIMRNYSVTTCNSKGQCTTRYYCDKSNVTVFKISKDGSIVWASNLDRFIKYSGWNIFDINVINKEGKFYVTYGSAYNKNADKKNFSSKKSRAYAKNIFEYAVFDYATGDFSKNEYKINSANAKGKEVKTISPLEIEVVDNHFYVNSIKRSFKPFQTALGCLGCMVCFPVGYFYLLSGKPILYQGYLGSITPIK